MNEAQTHEKFDRARRELRDAGRNVWLAGLGAVAEVGERSGQLDHWLDRLAERGRPIDERQRKAFEEIGERTGSTVREMKKLFEDTVQYESKSLLKRLGLMTRDDVKVLAARIDSLSAKVDELVASYAIAAAEPFEVDQTAGEAPKSRRPRPRKTERKS
ncbi:MAG TPA: phasin family protein [Thermoanaerobaculia bacterium]|nr:phasin family protein [Thermoanaerobaculia bacterium]